MKYLKIIGISILTLFSFYYTDKMVGISVANDPIMQQIKKVSKDSYVAPLDIMVTKDTVKAGLSGVVVDEDASYEKMKKLGSFNENFLVFNEIKPNEDIKAYYDKYVVGGSKNNEIALVFTTNDKQRIIEYQNVLETYSSVGMFFLDGTWMDKEKPFLKTIKDAHETFQIGNYGYDGEYQKSTVGYTNAFIYRYSDKTNFYCIKTNKNNNALEACKDASISTIKPIEIPIQKMLFSFKNNLKGGAIYHFDGTKDDLASVLQYVFQKGFKVVSLDILLEND